MQVLNVTAAERGCEHLYCMHAFTLRYDTKVHLTCKCQIIRHTLKVSENYFLNNNDLRIFLNITVGCIGTTTEETAITKLYYII